MAQTALARQLKKLAVPQTSLLLQDKVRASLLFDPREASGVDKDTVYAIGLTGLEELELIEPLFSQFHKNLFDESSKHVERSVQDQDANRKLDAAIDEFLALLSPYFLLRPSHKALEWLIYRFHIHMFNIDSFIATILPFHEAKIFVRALQLLDLRDPAGKWHWLRPLQKKGISLPKSTLITHSYKDLSFMKFVCSLVPRILQAYSSNRMAVCHTPISFYAVTIIGALERTDEISENMVALLLPYLLLGLRSKNLDYCASTFMIVCQLAKKITMNSAILEKLLLKIFSKPKKKIMDECFLCLLVVCQHQKLLKLPKKILIGFRDNQVLLKEMVVLAEKYYIMPLLMPLLRCLLPAVMREVSKNKTLMLEKKTRWSNKQVLDFLLREMTLTNEIVDMVVRFLLKKYVKFCKLAKKSPKTFNVNSLQKKSRSILERLEQRCPERCDAAIEKTLKKMEPEAKKIVQRMINQCSSGTKHCVLGNSNTTLFLSINHPSASRRVMAVEALINMLQNKTSLTDLGFVCEALLQRLLDDNEDVVASVLKLGEKLFTLLPKTELFGTLCNVLKKNTSTNYQKWLNVKMSILKLMCGNEEVASQLREDILPLVLPFLLPFKSSAVNGVRVILSSQLAKVDPLLSAVSEDVLDKLSDSSKSEITNKDVSEISSTILLAFSNAASALESSDFNHMIDTLVEASETESNWNSTILAFFIFNMVACRNETKYSDEMTALVINLASKWLPKCKALDNEENWGPCLRRGQLPLHVVNNCLKSIVQISANVSGTNESRSELFAHLTEFSASSKNEIAHCYRDLLGLFLKVHFKDACERIKFLSSFWNGNSHSLQVRSLYMSTAILAAGTLPSFFEEGNEEIARLLFCLISPIVVVREAALKLMQRALDRHEGGELLYCRLFAYLISHSEEIEADENQVPQLVSSWWSDALNEVAVPTGVRTRSQAVKVTLTNPALVLNDFLGFCKSEKISAELKNSILILLKECQSEFVLSELLPVLNEEIKNCDNVGTVSALSTSTLRLLFGHFNQKTASLLSGRETAAYETLERAIRCQVKGEVLRDSVQQMALKVLCKKYFLAIPSKDVQLEILDLILTLYVECENSAVAEQLFKVLKKLSTDCESIIAKLLQLPDPVISKQTVKEIRLSRVTDDDECETGSSILEKKEWRKVTAVLEILQSKEELMSAEAVIPVLFDILNKSLEMESNPQTEYLRQLVLSSLSNCFQQTQGSKLQEKQMQVELAVQCIRISVNPQTQQLALALLNTAAVLFPDHVLHNIMAIFTFMGTSLVRQDDSYSFQMTLKTVDTIIPALLEASYHQVVETKTDDVIAAVTRVFVDAFRDIPQHRRVPLFSRLITTLGASEYLWLPLSQLMDSVVSKPKDDVDEKVVSSIYPEEIEFGISLCQNFKPSVQVKTSLRILEYISLLPTHKNKETTSSFEKLFDVELRSEKQLRHFKYLAVEFLTLLFSSEIFIGQVAELKLKASSRLEVLFQKLLESTLQYVQQVAQQMQFNDQSQATRFWNSLLQKLYELLDKINSLLPPQEFVTVVRGLMAHPLPSVRRKAIEMLNSKLMYQPDFFRPHAASLLLDLVRPLSKAAKGKKNLESGDNEESVLNQQTALFALKLLCNMIGESNPAPFKKVLTVVVTLLKRSRNYQRPHLTSSALLCLAELFRALKEDCVPVLNKFMLPFLEILQDLDTLNSNEHLLLSMTTALHRLIMNMSSFLSSFMPTLLTQVCLLKTAHPGTPETGKTKSPLELRLRAVGHLLASNIPLRVFLPASTHCYRTLEEGQKIAIASLMTIAAEKMASLEKEEISDHLLEIQEFFLTALDFRSQWKKAPLSDVAKVEESVILALQAFVLKLSESNFRPFFYKIYDWATRDDDETDRTLTFYCLTDSLAQKLKSIFVLFASHFIGNAASLLDLNNNSKADDSFFGDGRKTTQKTCHLLVSILSTLQHCFLHDSKHLANRDCFSTLMQPLVDQIENTVGDEDEYKRRIENNVAPCLAQFAVATADDTCWKPLNYQILLKTRSSSPLVRFAALHVVREIVVKLGENYMVLLPESIPFLAELMEDESFEVEQQCQKVVSEMEQILGESLTKYF